MFENFSTQIILIVLGVLIYLFMGLCFNKQYQRNRAETYMIKFEIRKLTAVHAYYCALVQEPYNREFIAYHAPEFLIFDENEYENEQKEEEAQEDGEKLTENKGKQSEEKRQESSDLGDEEKQELSIRQKLIERQKKQNKNKVQRLPIFEKTESFEDNTAQTLLVIFFWFIACCFILRNEDELNEGRKDIKKLRKSINKQRQQLKPSFNNEQGYETDRTFSQIGPYTRKFSGAVELTSNFSVVRKPTGGAHGNDNFISLFRRNLAQNQSNVSGKDTVQISKSPAAPIPRKARTEDLNDFKSQLSVSNPSRSQLQVSSICEILHDQTKIQQQDQMQDSMEISPYEKEESKTNYAEQNNGEQPPKRVSKRPPPKDAPKKPVSANKKKKKQKYDEDDEKNIDSSGSD